jgi:hypothetical protein
MSARTTSQELTMTAARRSLVVIEACRDIGGRGLARTAARLSGPGPVLQDVFHGIALQVFSLTVQFA